jgi:peptidoglycan/LPS O-acetylase OafA/YrhL
MQTSHTTRYSELDWLRVILIVAVFMHHVFMPFNGDGWHIMNKDSSKTLDDIMVYFEQLRLQTLFFIAGAGSLLLLQKTTIKAFLANKFFRLFIPFLIGMMIIVPPQNYYESIDKYSSIFDAYKALIFSFDTNHLWFIEFLILFMILAIPLNLGINTSVGSSLIKIIEKVATRRHGIFSIVFVLIVLRCGLKLLNSSQEHSIHNLSVSAFFFFFFIAGMCFMKSPLIWQSIGNFRRTNLLWLIVSTLLFYAYYFSPDLSPYFSLEIRWMIWWLVCSLVSWSGLLSMLGYASHYCKKTPRWLVAANELIYPFYILHQTVIVVLAYYIVQWQSGIAVKSISLLLGAFVICVALCLMIKPFNLLRYLFGLRAISSDR